MNAPRDLAVMQDEIFQSRTEWRLSRIGGWSSAALLTITAAMHIIHPSPMPWVWLTVCMFLAVVGFAFGLAAHYARQRADNGLEELLMHHHPADPPSRNSQG